MSTFQVHSIETAPEGSKPLLQGMKEGLGMVPSLAAAMSESPQLLGGFLAVRDIYLGGTFSPGEIQVLSLTAAYENDCAWCMAFHTLMALKEGVSPEDVDALRAGLSPSEPRLGRCNERNPGTDRRGRSYGAGPRARARTQRHQATNRR